MTKMPEKAAAILGKRDLKDLIRDFVMTGVMMDRGHGGDLPTVRGWIMEELEKRNPKAFDEWLEGDAEDSDLEKYFLKD